MWENLFEDERIEEKVRQESPGFAGYLQATKRALFEKKEFGCGVAEWDRQPEYATGTLIKPGASDIDRINMIIFGFIRCGHLLTQEMKEWETLTSRCPFTELRALFPAMPEDEETVEKYGEILDIWYQTHLDDYSDLMSKTPQEVAGDLQSGEGAPGDGEPGDGEPGESPSGQSSPGQSNESQTSPPQSSQDESSGDSRDAQEPESGESGDTQGDGSAEGDKSGESTDDGTQADGSSQSDGQDSGSPGVSPSVDDIKKRMDSYKYCQDQDNEIKGDQKKMEELIDKYGAALREYKDAKTVGESQTDADDDTRAQMFEEDKGKIEKQIIKNMEERMEAGRFSIQDLMDMLRRIDSISSPLNREESQEIARVDALRVELGPDWQPDKTTTPVSTVISHPVVTDRLRKKYKAYFESVRKDIARMRGALRFRVGTRKVKRTELREGKFNRRMLGRAMQTDRIFYSENEITDQGLAIAILLDESGSMSSIPPVPRTGNYIPKSQRAMQIGVLLVESLTGLPKIELEVYSFTTGHSYATTTFKYLYGRNNPKKEAIADYAPGASNYDYSAISTAVDQLKKYTVEETKLLVVISDGAPCGSMGRYDAEECTKIAVDRARKDGVQVLQIAIEDHMNSDNMYGKQNVIKFTDMSDLVNNMRRFVTRIIRSVTNV